MENCGQFVNSAASVNLCKSLQSNRACELTDDDAIDQQKARIFISFKTNSSSRPHLIILIFQ